MREWTVGKQDPQAPLAVQLPKQPEQPEQPEQPSTSPEWKSEETLVETYEEGIQEEKELMGDAGHVPEPSYTQWWDDMRGGSQYEALSSPGTDNQGISSS